MFGITPNYDINRCYIGFNEAQATAAISSAVKSISPYPERVVVIGNYEGVSLGCTDGVWTYVSAGAREMGGVLEHEFGHLIAGLFDEFPLPLNPLDYPGPDVDGPNCSNVFTNGAPSPLWMNSTWPQAPVNRSECRHYTNKIVRPFDDCRMRSADTPFCYVCSAAMSSILGLFTNATMSQVVTRPPILQAGLLQPGPARGPKPATGPPNPGGPAVNDRSVRAVVQLTRGEDRCSPLPDHGADRAALPPRQQLRVRFWTGRTSSPPSCLAIL